MRKTHFVDFNGRLTTSIQIGEITSPAMESIFFQCPTGVLPTRIQMIQVTMERQQNPLLSIKHPMRASFVLSPWATMGYVASQVQPVQTLRLQWVPLMSVIRQIVRMMKSPLIQIGDLASMMVMMMTGMK